MTRTISISHPQNPFELIDFGIGAFQRRRSGTCNDGISSNSSLAQRPRCRCVAAALLARAAEVIE